MPRSLAIIGLKDGKPAQVKIINDQREAHGPVNRAVDAGEIDGALVATIFGVIDPLGKLPKEFGE